MNWQQPYGFFSGRKHRSQRICKSYVPRGLIMACIKRHKFARHTAFPGLVAYGLRFASDCGGFSLDCPLDPRVIRAYVCVMNMHMPAPEGTPLPDQAILHYGDGDYTLMKPGKFVICAVSKRQIPLEALKYWNPRVQEAYAGPEEALARWKELNKA